MSKKFHNQTLAKRYDHFPRKLEVQGSILTDSRVWLTSTEIPLHICVRKKILSRHLTRRKFFPPDVCTLYIFLAILSKAFKKKTTVQEWADRSLKDFFSPLKLNAFAANERAFFFVFFPDRIFHNFKASKSRDRELYVVSKRHATDLKALESRHGRPGLFIFYSIFIILAPSHTIFANIPALISFRLL